MDSDAQRVKDRLNIVDVVGQYVQLRRAGRNFVAKCPFHKERTPSFHVSPERGTYMCFGCGEKGDIFSFIQKMDGVDFPTALRQLAERAGVVLLRRFTKAPEQKEKEERLREVCEASVRFFEDELKKRKDVQDYLKTRGVKPETALAWRLGYAPADWEQLSHHLISIGFKQEEIVDAGFAVKSEKKQGEIFDRFRGRVVFPIFDTGGAPIAVSGRFYEKVSGSKGEEPAKYVNSPETLIFKKSRTLYGLERAKAAIRKADCILLVEGQFDLILAHQSGLPFAVALSGTALTHEHLSLLSRLSKRLVLALDADPAGLRAGLRSAHMAIAMGFEVKVPTFPQGEDPADLGGKNPELLKAAVRTSKGAVEFFLDALRAGAKDERAYQKSVETQVLPLIAAMESRIEQEHSIKIVSRAIGVSQLAVAAQVEKVPAAQGQESSPEIQQESTESKLDVLQKKIGMLLFYFPKKSSVHERLVEMFGAPKVEEIYRGLEPRAEELRFAFERELGEHTSEELIAEDVLLDLAQAIERERVKRAFV